VAQNVLNALVWLAVLNAIFLFPVSSNAARLAPLLHRSESLPAFS
jgi:hypothetical protein